MGLVKASLNTYATPLPLKDILVPDILWLDKAIKIDYHETTSNDILAGVENGTYELWRLSPPGIAVTMLVQAVSWRELVCVWAAGEEFLDNIGRLIEELSDVAKALGCKHIACIAGRPGLMKIYKRYGKPAGQIFIKEL